MPGGCLPGGGVGLPGGVCPGGCLTPVDRMTDVSENITFPQLLLRTVTRYRSSINCFCYRPQS